ncbi:MAG: anhydro-N-acetylmuramic acid kinase [Armatimonadetes bacterium]|nr:anhydro-N-acetylmuramic acid kinase [Armatimonadota bacterium]
MSGTSVDGIDAALVSLWREGGWPRVRLEAFVTHPYPDETRQGLFAAFAGRRDAGGLCRLNVAVGEAFAAAAKAVAVAAGVSLDTVAFIASHGQTVWHEPPASLQVGEPCVIAQRTGCPVVADFRPRDLAAGGQGAPLVPYVDWLLFADPTRTRAIQNIGGIANVTCLPAGGGIDTVIAFDTGPGNVPIDAAAMFSTQGRLRCDEGGRLAAQGQVDAKWLAWLLEDEYFHRAPPKSAGREQFGELFVSRLWYLKLRGKNLVATLTALTVESIALAYERWLPPVDEVVVGGGGARNPFLMAALARRLAPACVTTYEEFGLHGDAKEAVAFAILGYETLAGRPANVPAATGARQAVVLGKIIPGSAV